MPGEFVLAENVNLAARMPGVTVNGGGNCLHCGIDENVSTTAGTAGNRLEIVFPADVTVTQVTIVGHRNRLRYEQISAGIFELIDANGVELYDSGPVIDPGPLFDAHAQRSPVSRRPACAVDADGARSMAPAISSSSDLPS